MTAIWPTDPEPRRDLEAQFEALVDPRHPKRAVWVSAGNAVAGPLVLRAVGWVLELPAGTLYARPRDLQKLLADPSLEMLAQILGYAECKAALRGDELPVVQALNEDGWVVQEMVSSWEWVGAAKDIAVAYGTVRIVSMAACRERRRRLIAKEAGGKE